MQHGTIARASRAFMLEFSYMLTVAASMANCRLESFGWMDAWHAGILACVTNWQTHSRSAIADGDAGGRAIYRGMNPFIRGLAPGYSTFMDGSLASPQDVAAYVYLLEQTERFAHASEFTGWGLSDSFTLGRQLAQNDLHAHYAALGRPELRVIVSRHQPLAPFSGNPFPLPWPGWPLDPAFNENLNQYIANRHRFAGATTFSAGPMMRMVQSIVYPSHFPSTLWCWEGWEEDEPWRLFLAGELCRTPTFIAVKDRNDKAFVALLEAMVRDVDAGLPMDKCGWIRRSGLWPHMSNGNTRSKAWKKLKETLAILGELEFDGGVGKYKNGGGGFCRAPVALAGPECMIFVEKQK